MHYFSELQGTVQYNNTTTLGVAQQACMQRDAASDAARSQTRHGALSFGFVATICFRGSQKRFLSSPPLRDTVRVSQRVKVNNRSL